MPFSQELQSWKNHIREGNSDFDKHHVLLALAHYHKAIELAKSLFDSFDDPKEAVAALVVSHHNLADLYVRENQCSLAEQQHREIHQKLSALLSDAAPDAPEIDALMWGVSKTYVALVKHLKNHQDEMATEPPALPNLFKITFKKKLN